MTDKATTNLSRRDALKLLGAAAGASVLANLPSRWSTPEVTAGVLPAHAQASCTGYGLVFQTVGAPYLDMTFQVFLGPDPDGITGNGYPATWTWDATHCDCIVFQLIVGEPPDWTTSNSSGPGPFGSMTGESTLHVASNLATGAIVASQDIAEFAEGFNQLGCGSVIG